MYFVSLSGIHANAAPLGATATAPLNSNATSDGGDDWDVQLTTNGTGTWIAVWDSTDTLDNTIVEDSDILYAVTTDNGPSWSSPDALKDNA